MVSIAGSSLAAAMFVLVANKISSAEGKRARSSCDAADASNVSPKAGLKSRPIRRGCSGYVFLRRKLASTLSTGIPKKKSRSRFVTLPRCIILFSIQLYCVSGELPVASPNSSPP